MGSTQQGMIHQKPRVAHGTKRSDTNMDGSTRKNRSQTGNKTRNVK
ncbi:MAG TPA: hypothetical protein VJY54_11800 [Lachnospiraceae bacterium]|nr:hypothetical protein [Lachnospiraceae bacterium]